MLSGKAQLAAAQLDSLGNKDAGDKVLLSNTAQVLLDMGGVFVKEYLRRMQRSGNVDTGNGGDLVHISEIEIEGRAMSLDIMVPEYLLYQSFGVNGTEKHRGSVYSYGLKMPPVAPILAWARRRANRADKYSSIQRSKNKKGMDKDRKLKSIVKQSNNYKSLAFAIAKNIQKKGIEATKDLQNTGVTIERIFKKEIAQGFKLDIINNLK